MAIISGGAIWYEGDRNLDNFIFDGSLNTFFLWDNGAESKITEKDEASIRHLTGAKHERLLGLKYHPNIPIGALGNAE